jgi:hypothetical protein
MTQTLFLAAIVAVFATFGLALAYGQMAARGITAPGARPLD